MDYFFNLITNKEYSLHGDESSFRNWFLSEVKKNCDFFLDKKMLLFLPKAKGEFFISGGKIFKTESEYMDEMLMSIAPFGAGGKFIGFINDNEGPNIIKFGVNLDDQSVTYQVRADNPEDAVISSFKKVTDAGASAPDLPTEYFISSIIGQFKGKPKSIQS